MDPSVLLKLLDRATGPVTAMRIFALLQRRVPLFWTSYVLVIMTGCGPTLWEHPLKGVESLPQDRADCERLARYAEQEGDPHGGNVLPFQERINECLEGRGYVKRSVGE